jgi:septal ring factor EnvC (AmiA/AmiB activator)
VLLAAALVLGAPPQDPSSPEAMAARAAARIKELQREADSLASRERTLLDDLRKLEVERDLRAEEFAASTRDLQRIEREIDDTATRIVALEQTAQSQLPDLSARMVELYKVGNGGYLRLLLSVDDLRRQAWNIVAPVFSAAQSEALGRYRDLLSAGKASSDLAKILSAAQQGRVDTLFVPVGVQQWGVFDVTTGQIDLHREPQSGDQDLLDADAVSVFRAGGTVYAIEPERMPDEPARRVRL